MIKNLPSRRWKVRRSSYKTSADSKAVPVDLVVQTVAALVAEDEEVEVTVVDSDEVAMAAIVN